ncbi:g2453 [Coccomyxa viridis]|uniref:G2453 protein n=1 Tax=Coccomyxa viridis TaxID=1274662 RepID=A0ABP1FQM9_9CHLO
MAFSMKTVAPSTKLLAPRPLSIRARTSRATFGRSRLVIEAKTVWELEAGGANKNKETVTLNDKINESKSLVSVGDSKHEGAEKVLEGDAGVYLKFIAKGESEPVDSPGELWVTDEGSEVEVKLDGTPLKKGEETKLGVGMTISYGSTEYKVLRNAEAHA